MPAVTGSRRIGARLGPVDPARMPPEERGEAVKLTRVDATSLPPPDSARPLVQTQNVPNAATLPATTPADPPFETQSIPAAKAPAAVVASAPAASASSRLAGLLEGLERESESAATLPNAAELRAARAAAKKKMAQLAAQTAAEQAAKREKAEKEAAAKRNPARIWVQIATGRNNSGLGLTLRRIRSENEVALKGLSGWSASYKATNRILVGPMKSAAAARELVGKLAKNGVSAMTFTSGAGEEVEKIAAK